MAINTPGSGGDKPNLHTLNSVNQNTSSEIGRTIGREYTITSYLGENPDKEELIAAIKSAIELIKKEDIYASGSEGEIYRIKIADTKGGTRDLLVAKKRFDNKPDNEYTLHDRIRKLVKEGDPVKVPMLWGKFPHKGDEYIVMDFVKGKTLYHKIAEGIIEAKARQIESQAITETEKNVASTQAYNLRNRIRSAKSDSDVDHIFLEWYRYDSKKADEAFDREKLKVQIFRSEEGKKILKELGDFIEKLHKNGFYHRDLHEKNIIFGDDGKIYVIDFGKTFFNDPDGGRPSDTEVYVVDMGEQEGVYLKDEDILGIINKITKTKDQEEGEALSQQFRERAKELTKGKMVVESIDFGKMRSKKLINRIKKYFGGFEQLRNQIGREEKSEISTNSFLGAEEKDIISLLFSMTKENLQFILNEDILKEKQKVLQEIKNKWNPKLGKQSWIDLFGDDDKNIDVEFLYDVLNKMYNKKGYEEIYKGKGLDFIRELKPMVDNAKRLVKIEEIKGYLKEIDKAIV